LKADALKASNDYKKMFGRKATNDPTSAYTGDKKYLYKRSSSRN